MCLGVRVSWHFFALGSNHDLHTVGLEGNSLSVNDRNLDVEVLTTGLGFEWINTILQMRKALSGYSLSVVSFNSIQ